MKKSNYFRIQLFDGAVSLCDSLVLLAAKSNSGDKQITLQQLKTIADAQVIMYPSLNSDTSIEIIGDTLLHVDTKRGDTYKTVCIIEEVEVLELQNVDDIPENLFTAYNGHGALAD